MKRLLLTVLLTTFLSNITYSQNTTTDIFISEYSEGSSYNKYIEIYNGTGTPVDLAFYEIWKITNGGNWPEYILPLSGILADGDVYVIAHGSADPFILMETDLISGVLNFNGDDAIGLSKMGMLIDVIGMDGPDPGSGWDVAGISDATKDHTLIRKCSVFAGNIDWILSSGLDSISSEWIVLPQNDWSDIGTHTFPCQSSPIYGCTDSSAYNYNSVATIDDGSCIYSCSAPTNLQLQTAFDVQAWVQWDEMSSPSGISNDSVDFYKVLYRPVGDTSWLIKQKSYDGNQTPTVRVRLQFLSPSTQYEMKIKAGYNSGCTSDFSSLSYFYTLDECPNISNFSIFSPNTTKAIFSWDTNGTYSFVRIKLRVDTLNASWLNAGGFGVFHPITSKAKNGLIAGESYRAQARTWCDPNGGPYRSSTWTSLIFWTQPSNSSRLAGKYSNINNIDIYPNPSREVFNVNFIIEEKENLSVKIFNMLGKEIYSNNIEQFIGEYNKQINLNNYPKSIYLLEIKTNSNIIKRKLVLQ